MKKTAIILLIVVLGGCSTLPDSAQLRIVRDDYGVPHIYADNIYGLYYGYGYAIAQDRLFQMEMARRSTQGTVAEVFGSEYLEYDKSTRQLFDPSSIQRQLNELAEKDKYVFEGYAAGMNAWLAEIRYSPDRLSPKQFLDLGFSPADWTAYDVAILEVAQPLAATLPLASAQPAHGSDVSKTRELIWTIPNGIPGETL